MTDGTPEMWNEGSAGHYMPPHVRGFMAIQHICIVVYMACAIHIGVADLL